MTATLRDFLLCLTTVAALALAAGGCVILPAEGRTLVSDIHAIKQDLNTLAARNAEARAEFDAWSRTTDKKRQLRFEQLRDRLIDMEARMGAMEREMLEMRATINSLSHGGAAAGPGAGDEALSTRVTSGGLTIKAREMHDLAQVSMANGRFADAAREFAAVVDQFPDSPLAPAAQFGLGECLENQRDYEEAVEAYAKVPERWPDADEAPAARYRQAVCLRQIGQTARAIEILEEVVRRYPTYGALHRVKQTLDEYRRP